jgi:hypothetical protein
MAQSIYSSDSTRKAILTAAVVNVSYFQASTDALPEAPQPNELLFFHDTAAMLRWDGTQWLDRGAEMPVIGKIGICSIRALYDSQTFEQPVWAFKTATGWALHPMLVTDSTQATWMLANAVVPVGSAIYYETLSKIGALGGTEPQVGDDVIIMEDAFTWGVGKVMNLNTKAISVIASPYAAKTMTQTTWTAVAPAARTGSIFDLSGLIKVGTTGSESPLLGDDIILHTQDGATWGQGKITASLGSGTYTIVVLSSTLTITPGGGLSLSSESVMSVKHDETIVEEEDGTLSVVGTKDMPTLANVIAAGNTGEELMKLHALRLTVNGAAYGNNLEIAEGETTIFGIDGFTAQVAMNAAMAGSFRQALGVTVLPVYPSADGDYILHVTMASGVPTLSWEVNS